jgi:murein DD-endopeptidase MepM/ murein hydrolase activator NlpD
MLLAVSALSLPTPTGASPPAVRPVRRHLSAVTAPSGLGFPYRDAGAASALYCFALNPWAANGEIHNGIDVVAAHDGSQSTMTTVAVVTPAGGRVEWVVTSTSGAGLASVLVVLRINDFWFATLTIEPQSASTATNDEQMNRIHVAPGQTVRAGDLLAELVVWNIAAGSYPHVHIGLLYKSPSETLEAVRDRILGVAISTGSGQPPTSGPGSPWDPADLGIPTTFFCPYEYSSPEAKADYDRLPKFAANGDPCRCPCAYGSAGGDCGACRR